MRRTEDLERGSGRRGEVRREDGEEERSVITAAEPISQRVRCVALSPSLSLSMTCALSSASTVGSAL